MTVAQVYKTPEKNINVLKVNEIPTWGHWVPHAAYLLLPCDTVYHKKKEMDHKTKEKYSALQI